MEAENAAAESTSHTRAVEGQEGSMSAGGQYERGQEEQTLWYARSCTCGTIIDVLSALEGTPVKGGVGPQAAIEISEEAGLQVRVLEGTAAR